WCMEAVFQEMDGVSEVYSGYTGGHKENPAYSEVASGTTGHLEAVEVYYDPSVVTYEELLEAFWTNIDPTDGGGQFVDRGPQYGTAVFYHDETQRELAEQSKIKLWESGRLDAPVVTEIRPAEVFYIAEEYHQDYYIKRTFQYRIYESGSGREERLGELWEE
ncbi:TPA: peptide-methionine (S)-S-oxide reductase MsrA, partial [Candidatus Micrarchaeota archaeon]|nr:peptide-methionine (S)-S-oxide reductase MsrA [Candidatus Micrarchaeota archaeon]